MHNNLYPYISSTAIAEWTRDELFKVSATLELEYLGGSPSLDFTNIASLVKSTSKKRAQQFALHQSIVAPIIEKENTTYINAPTRIYQTKNGKDPSKKVLEQINNIYDQLNFDMFMQLAEHMTALTGTTIFRPVYVEDLSKWKMVHLSPALETLNIIGHASFPGEPIALTYKDKIGDQESTISWDLNVIRIETQVNSRPTILEEEHNLGRLPFEVLKFVADNRRPFGFPDFELYSLCRHRSLVLSNSMARMHLSDFEKLVLTGVDMETAMSNIRDKIVAMPAYAIEGTDKVIQPTAQYIAPDGQDALNLLKGYFEVLRAFLDMRGHVQKIFSRGADVPSAESIRLGSVELSNKQQRKRKFLESFEQGLWDLIKKQNNATPGLSNIPEDITLRIDYLPDPYSFNSAADEVAYFNAAISAGVSTPIAWIMNRNPEYNEDEAKQAFKHNQDIMDELNITHNSDHDEDVVDEDEDNNSPTE